MSTSPMGVFLLSVLLFFVVVVLAVTPCNQPIIEMLKTKSSCYTGGVAPKQKASGDLETHIVISPEVGYGAPKCLTSHQKENKAYVKLFFQDNVPVRTIHATYTHELKGDYILETTDATGRQSRMYVIHNEDNVYSYYRCTEPGTKSGQTPVVSVAVGCKFLDDPKAQAVVAKSKECFKEMGIEKTTDLTPCGC